MDTLPLAKNPVEPCTQLLSQKKNGSLDRGDHTLRQSLRLPPSEIRIIRMISHFEFNFIGSRLKSLSIIDHG
jgi:hypothetical protein